MRIPQISGPRSGPQVEREHHFPRLVQAAPLPALRLIKAVGASSRVGAQRHDSRPLRLEPIQRIRHQLLADSPSLIRGSDEERPKDRFGLHRRDREGDRLAVVKADPRSALTTPPHDLLPWNDHVDQTILSHGVTNLVENVEIALGRMSKLNGLHVPYIARSGANSHVAWRSLSGC